MTAANGWHPVLMLSIIIIQKILNTHRLLLSNYFSKLQSFCAHQATSKQRVQQRW